MKPLILLPTVPWRSESLVSILDVLGRQTVAPWVKVIVDPGGKLDDAVFDVFVQHITANFWPKNLQGEIVQGSTTKAQCVRWWHVEQCAPDQIVMTLDDDLVIDEHYVENMLESYNDLVGGSGYRIVLSGGGVDINCRWRHYYDVHDGCELAIPQTGLMVFRAGIWTGLSETRAAQHEYGHRRGGNEEVPLAVFAHEHGIRFFRPTGQVATPHKLAFDERSVSKTTQYNLRALLDWTRANTKWPYAKAYNDLLDGKVPRAPEGGE